MSNSITQDMAFRQSLMQYAQKYGVSRASRKYNKSRSYIYFWKKRWDGSVASLACASRRPHSHPNQHTEDELKLIRDMRRRNPKLGMLELWHRLRQRGYSRCPESLFRVMRKLGLFPAEKPKKKYKPKPYEQMTHPGERVQVDVKVVPRRCIADPPLSTSSHGCAFWRRIRSNPPIPRRTSCAGCGRGTPAEAYKWSVSRRTTGSSLPTVFLTASAICPRCLRKPPPSWAFATS